MSDMAHKLSGIKQADRLQAQGTAELALWSCSLFLKVGGAFTAKMFKSQEADDFYRSFRPLFKTAKRIELNATRKTSKEFYIVGKGYSGKNLW